MVDEYYSNGLKFDNTLAKNIDEGLKRVDKRKATCIIIDGGVGEGKTTLATLVADYVNQKKGLPVINLNSKTECHQLGMGGKEFTSKLRNCFLKGLPVVIYDEAGDYSKRGAMTQFNAFLNRVFETYRGLKIIVIICLPNMGVLDNTLFDNKIPRLLLHVYGRENDGNYKGYSLKKMYELRRMMSKLADKNFAYTAITPNFYGQFKNLSTERETQLDKLSVSGKLEILEGAELKMEGLVDKTEMCNKLAKSLSWLNLVLLKLNIKPVKYIKNRAYYKKEHIDTISDWVLNGGVVDKYVPKRVKQ